IRSPPERHPVNLAPIRRYCSPSSTLNCVSFMTAILALGVASTPALKVAVRRDQRPPHRRQPPPPMADIKDHRATLSPMRDKNDRTKALATSSRSGTNPTSRFH